MPEPISTGATIIKFLPIVISLLGSLFQKRGGGQGQDLTTTQETTTQPPGARSPLGIASSVPMLQMLFKNMQRFQGAGFPAGQGDILGGTGFPDLMALLAKQWPELMREFAGETTPLEQRQRNRRTGGAGLLGG